MQTAEKSYFRRQKHFYLPTSLPATLHTLSQIQYGSKNLREIARKRELWTERKNGSLIVENMNRMQRPTEF